MRTVETLTRDVRAELARITKTNEQDWFLVFRARYGMETVLEALAKHAGAGEVITQPFTCTTALNPIMSAGHRPVYVDANYDDLSLDTSKLTASSSSRALIMQHSFGMVSNVKKAREFADTNELLLLEDSAHQLGLLARDGDTILADISVHSFGVEKLLPTKFGGAVWVNPAMKNTALRSEIRTALAQLPVVSGKAAAAAKRYRGINRLLNHTPTRVEPLLRSFVTQIGLFQPAIMPQEVRGKNQDAPSAPNEFILEGMLKGLASFDATTTLRRSVAAVYQTGMPQEYTIPAALQPGCAPVRFPVICADQQIAAALFDKLRAHGHYSGKWYRPIPFPGIQDQSLYKYDASSCPTAEDISARILNLPTNITPTEAKEILDVLRRETNR